ncbi:MAG: hypothetical protein KIT84_27175 [Labilithrix sp.]|nr:hypothetical protein [Labilithrix sp.]MCW5814739.1 hypothetical protein [Labilithrix sp.]
MSSVLKGNFETKKKVEVADATEVPETVEARFEREALKRLGGSIAFVAKKKVIWDKTAPDAKPAKDDEK